jgi:hypothetical protein
VNFATDAAFASCNIDAETAEQALALAQKLYEDDPFELRFEPYDDMHVNEILVYDAAGNKLATWYSHGMRLRLAARDLLDFAETVALGTTEYDRLQEMACAAIAKAKGGAA